MSDQNHTYTIRIHNEGSEGLWAEVEDLPGCFASGQTWDELREALEDAISLYLSTPERRAHAKLDEVREVESVQVTEQRVLVC